VAKLLEVPRGIGEASLIRHMQRPMNIGASMQDAYDVEQRSLDGHIIRLHRPAEIVLMAYVRSLLTLWFSSRKSSDPSGFGNCTICFVIFLLQRTSSLTKNIQATAHACCAR
jgi:hypothetical protein